MTSFRRRFPKISFGLTLHNFSAHNEYLSRKLLRVLQKKNYGLIILNERLWVPGDAEHLQ